MSENVSEQVQEPHDEDEEFLVGEPVEAQHDLDVDSFDEVEDTDGDFYIQTGEEYES